MKQQTKRRIAACAAGFALPRYNDIPSVGPYLDQAVQYVNGQYRCFPGVVLTPSMVSNYVKQGLVNHPVKKKYTREQLACLTCIALAKTVLSMENIRMLLEMQRASYPIQVVYDLFCDELEACLPCVFGLRRGIPALPPDAPDERLLLRSTILAAANKLYLDCSFEALQQDHSLWPDILQDLA